MRIRTANREVLPFSQIEDVDIKPQHVTGVLVFDSHGKVVRSASEFLCKQVEGEAISHASAKTYARNIAYFVNYLESRPENQSLSADEMLLNMRRPVLEDWAIHEKEISGLDRNTIRNREGALRAFYTYLAEPKDGEDRPFIEKYPFPDRFISPKATKKQVKRAELDELLALMLECRCERERLLFQFMYDSGVRISEVERVTFGSIQDAINFSQKRFIGSNGLDVALSPGYGPILIQGSKGRQNSIKERYSIITTPTLHRIAGYHSKPLYKRYQQKYQNRNDCPAFLNTNGDPYTKESLAKLIARRSNSAKKKGAITRNVHAHLFRHGSAYLTLDDPNFGEDFLDRLVSVQKTLGHSSVTTTEMYTSIPHDIYNHITNSVFGHLKSKIDKMEILVEKTKLPIRLGDTQ